MTQAGHGFSAVPIVIVDEGEAERYLREGYNPPSFTDSNSREQFIDEWLQVFNEVKASVGAIWRFGISDGDFYMDSDWVPDRFLCIEVATSSMLQPLLMGIVHKTLLQFDADYSVDICNAWMLFEHREYSHGSTDSLFNIFVEKERIVAFSKSLDILDRLGLLNNPIAG